MGELDYQKMCQSGALNKAVSPYEKAAAEWSHAKENLEAAQNNSKDAHERLQLCEQAENAAWSALQAAAGRGPPPPMPDLPSSAGVRFR